MSELLNPLYFTIVGSFRIFTRTHINRELSSDKEMINREIEKIKDRIMNTIKNTTEEKLRESIVVRIE